MELKTKRLDKINKLLDIAREKAHGTAMASLT